MAFFTGTIYSEALNMETSLRVIVPPSGMAASKVLYLLHGLHGDSGDWTRRTCAESFAEARGYAVVMPEVQRSFYKDIRHGSQYFTYVSEELPAICEKLFGFTHVREKTFVAGLSMGGYGALKCALRRPDFYAACASFSGAVDLRTLMHLPDHQNRFPERLLILGEDGALDEDDDLFTLAAKVNALPTTQKPRVFTTCGLSDELYALNIRFRDHLRSLSFDYAYMEWPGGHTWPFWNESLPHALAFFDGEAPEK